MTQCNRCNTETRVTVMSMFNKDILCLSCKRKEQAHPRYKEAVAADNEQIRQGNYNFPGIGRPSDL